MMAVIFSACQKGEELPLLEIVYPYPEKSVALADPELMARNTRGVPVYNGGYGSSMAPVPGEEGAFYFLTDRGPAVNGAGPGEKVFIAKRFNPHIAKFKLTGDSMRIVSRILLNLPGGSATGIPNPPVGGDFGTLAGSTGETALDTLGQAIEPDPNGIDPEGLAVAPDGTFWVSDEYGPYLYHFSRSGAFLEKISPFEADTNGHSIPKVFARRRPNRGMEGLTMTPDGRQLVGIMQSPLDNPDENAGSASGNARILTYDIATGESRQYVYRMLSESTFNCEITAISNTLFLVLERDNKTPRDPADPSRYKHICRVNISEATDISDPENGLDGKLVSGRTIEQLSEAELSSAGIQPVSKELLTDLLLEFPDYPHDKPEGLALINNRKIAVVNDDDYGIRSTAPPGGQYISKILPLSDTTDQTVIYFIDLAEPLM